MLWQFTFWFIAQPDPSSCILVLASWFLHPGSYRILLTKFSLAGTGQRCLWVPAVQKAFAF